MFKRFVGTEFAKKVKPLVPVVAASAAAATIVKFSSIWSNSGESENSSTHVEEKKVQSAMCNNIAL